MCPSTRGIGFSFGSPTASTPSSLNVSVTVPAVELPRRQSHVLASTVLLPLGTGINPAAFATLSQCSDTHVHALVQCRAQRARDDAAVWGPARGWHHHALERQPLPGHCLRRHDLADLDRGPLPEHGRPPECRSSRHREQARQRDPRHGTRSPDSDAVTGAWRAQGPAAPALDGVRRRGPASACHFQHSEKLRIGAGAGVICPAC
jgi:hypothetical protein